MGRAVDRTERIPLRFGAVWMGDQQVAETDILGRFKIALPRHTERVVLTFTDPKFSIFHEATNVLHLKTDKSAISYTFYVPLLEKEPLPIEDNAVTITHKDTDLVKITFPDAGDIDMKELQAHATVMSQSIYGNTYKSFIGDSYTLDDNQLEQPISLGLLFCLAVMNGSDAALVLPGMYEFSFSKSEFESFAQNHGVDDMWLLELDSASGYWNKVAQVQMPHSEEDNNGKDWKSCRFWNFVPPEIYTIPEV